MSATTTTTRRLPGFGLSMGITLSYLSLIVLLPLACLLIAASGASAEKWWAVLSDARTLAALRVSVVSALGAALIATVIGLLVAWVLTRYRFWGRPVLDALVDIPFALPTAVAGIALATLYSYDGWIGRFLEPFGLEVAYRKAGIWLALIFIGLPFCVRSLQPVIEALEREVEEAASALGATHLQTFTRVILPHLMPALLTGFALALARGLGEYGSVIFIAGNVPFESEILPLLIVMKLEQYDTQAASILAVLMLVLSFLMLFFIHAVERLRRGD